MSSTDRRPLLTLSFRRAEVTAFWIFASVLFASATGVASRVAGARYPWIWAAAAMLAPAPGLLWAPWFVFGVRAWNKGARLVAAALRGYVLRVYYYLFFSSIRVGGSSLALDGDATGESLWLPKAERPGAIEEECAAKSILAARRPGAIWTLALVPMVFLLRIHGDDQSTVSPSSSTYTLY